jgi:hypothetical protein
MAAPTISGSTTVKEYGFSVAFSSATTNRNFLSNTAGSGKLVRLVSLVGVNNDAGASAVTAQCKRYNQDGAGINSDVGDSQVAYGSDTVAGSSLGDVIPLNVSIDAGKAVVLVDRNSPIDVMEDQSLVGQASAADDLTLNGIYQVIG